MFKHFLVPLDGSSLAEAILPLVQTFAVGLRASVTLLHVVEPSAPTTVHGQSHLANAADATAYLERIAASLRASGIQTDIHVDSAEGGDVVKAIYAHGGELGADLITLANHGHGGLRQALFGSIAQNVLKGGAIPVLLLKAESSAPPTSYVCKNILVPLDGSRLYEQALNVAVEIGCALGGTLHLVAVVPTLDTLSPERAATGILLPASTRAALEVAEAEVTDYLASKNTALASSGVLIETQVRRGEIPAELVAAEQESHSDLIVMATHGRAGFDAFWSGSIAPQVLSRAHAPVLLLRVVGDEPVR